MNVLLIARLIPVSISYGGHSLFRPDDIVPGALQREVSISYGGHSLFRPIEKGQVINKYNVVSISYGGHSLFRHFASVDETLFAQISFNLLRRSQSISSKPTTI